MRDGLLPTLSINYGGYWLEVTPENYSIELGNDVCSPCFGSYNIDYWILGEAFLRDWYVVHDYDNSRFGFTRLPGSGLTAPEPVVEPGVEINWRGILSVTWGISFSLAVFVYVWLNQPSSSSKKSSKAVQDNESVQIILLP